MSELLSYRYVCAELSRLRKLLYNIEQDRCGKSVNGEHVSCGIGDSTASTASKIVDLQARINCLAKQKNAVESYIESIERADIKYIMYARFIDNMSYPDISRELKRHKICISISGLRKKVARHVNK